MPGKLAGGLGCGLDERDKPFLSIYIHWILLDQLSGLIKSTIALTSKIALTGQHNR